MNFKLTEKIITESEQNGLNNKCEKDCFISNIVSNMKLFI